MVLGICAVIFVVGVLRGEAPLPCAHRHQPGRGRHPQAARRGHVLLALARRMVAGERACAACRRWKR